MAKRNFRYQHISSQTAGAKPTASVLKEAELGVNIAKDAEKIFLKNTNDEIVTFITEAQIDAKIASESGTTDGKIQVLSGAIDANSADIELLETSASTNASNISALDNNKFGAVSYDKTAKKINFYAKNTTTLLGQVDTTDFVKDGMIDSVELETKSGTTYLVITWNTDAGKETTELNIGDIFEADNYYTKAQTDTLLAGKVDNSVYNGYTAATDAAIALKANAADVYTKTETYTKTEIGNAIEAATSGKVDTSDFETFSANTQSALGTKLNKSDFDTYSAATETAIGGKQDTLVSGSNIKTVVSKTLLGSGNVEINIVELSDIDVEDGTVLLNAGTF